MARTIDIKEKDNEILGLTFEEAKANGFLDLDPMKVRTMGMTYDEAKESGLLDAAMTDNTEEDNRRPSWMAAIGI